MTKEIGTQRIAHIDSDQCCLLKAVVCKEELSMLSTHPYQMGKEIVLKMPSVLCFYLSLIIKGSL